MGSERSTTKQRSQAIDLLKGAAILSVICLHSLSEGTLKQIGAVFYIWQAVPVFVVLLGLNGVSSLRRRAGTTLRELYFRDYIVSRIDRLYVPFLAIILISAVPAVIMHRLAYHVPMLARDLLTGELPVAGPGTYFVTLLFQVVLVLPIVYWGLRRRPIATLLACLAITVAFETFAAHFALERNHPYPYEACLLRYLFTLALGGALAGASAARLVRARWFRAAALLSTVLLALLFAEVSWLPSSRYASGQGFPTAFYAAAIVMLGLRFLPAQPRLAPARLLAEIGRASYHIFLVQITWFWFSVWPVDSLPALLGNLAITVIAGLAFQRLTAWIPALGKARPVARRQALLAGAPQRAAA
jgi:peptidoglycan/LPS O-acetylase OafA/YrhL